MTDDDDFVAERLIESVFNEVETLSFRFKDQFVSLPAAEFGEAVVAVGEALLRGGDWRKAWAEGPHLMDPLVQDRVAKGAYVYAVDRAYNLHPGASAVVLRDVVKFLYLAQRVKVNEGEEDGVG